MLAESKLWGAAPIELSAEDLREIESAASSVSGSTFTFRFFSKP